jgi:UDP-3-O-[3-hydroxymyristoyl] glucosamine N-acyltransferase
MGSTVIRKGTKLDNMVQVAHNVEIGEHTVIASQTGIAGSTKIGNHCVFGGQTGIAGHITIAPFNSFGGQSGITSNISETHQKMSGTPAMNVNSYLRSVVGIQKLPQLLKEIESLKKEINRLKETHD